MCLDTFHLSFPLKREGGEKETEAIRNKVRKRKNKESGGKKIRHQRKTASKIIKKKRRRERSEENSSLISRDEEKGEASKKGGKILLDFGCKLVFTSHTDLESPNPLAPLSPSLLLLCPLTERNRRSCGLEGCEHSHRET
jgi:hypothetical protein